MRTSGAAALRRGSPIRAYVGPNGGGKTLAMVYDTLPALEMGRQVLSTVALYDPVTGAPHRRYRKLDDWRQLLDARNCDVLLDEVTGVASARSYAALPAQLINLFVQLRKRNVTIAWSSPNFARADVVLREVTRTVTVCKGHFPKRDPESMWPQRRIFVWKTYDSIDYEEFTLQKVDRVKALGRQVWYRSPTAIAAKSYKSLDEVSTLGHMDLTGTCLTCSGKKMQPKCSCPVDHEPVRPSQVNAGRGASEAAPAGDLHPLSWLHTYDSRTAQLALITGEH